MDRPAIWYRGAGAWGMRMSVRMTCVRHAIPATATATATATAILFHNRQRGAEKKNRVDFHDHRYVARELDHQSFAGIARRTGAEGVTIDTPEDVGRALTATIDAQMNHGKTSVIEIICTCELDNPFCRDALAAPSRSAPATSTGAIPKPRPVQARAQRPMNEHRPTLNAGSSLVKLALSARDALGTPRALKGHIDGMRLERCGAATHDEALADMLAHLHAHKVQVGAVDHRSVEVGACHVDPLLIDDAVVAQITEMATPAPLHQLHQLHNLAGMRAARHAFAGVRLGACSDTALDAAQPDLNRRFVLPQALFDEAMR